MTDADKVTLMQTGCERLDGVIADGGGICKWDKWHLFDERGGKVTGGHTTIIELIMALGGDE